MLIKICGLTRAEDAQVAVSDGAHLLGCILVPGSKRAISHETVCALRQVILETESTMTLPSQTPAGNSGWFHQRYEFIVTWLKDHHRPLLVGVVQNASVHEMVTWIEQGLDAIQFHGQESPSLIQTIKTRFPSLVLIRVVGVKETTTADEILARVKEVEGIVDLILLDTAQGTSSGGLGIRFDGHKVRSLSQQFPFIVAGGLTPANVQDAIHETGAWGVDTSSGVEQQPRIKDPHLIARFIQQANQRK